MKFPILSLLLIASAFAQMPSVPCIRAAGASSCKRRQSRTGPGAGGRTRSPPQSAADVAEIAKLMDLPAWGQNLANGDYSNGPAYPTAPELAKRAGVPEGKVIEFVMNSSESKFYPGVNGAFQRHVCVYVPAGYVAGSRTSGDRFRRRLRHAL